MSMIGNLRRVSRDRLAALRADPSAVPAFLYDEEPPPGDHLDLDKTWHAIHFLLNGQTWTGDGPLFDAVLGGEPLGEEDVGYGPARALTAEQVKATAQALADLPVETLLARFDAQTLNDNEIYPQAWTGEADDLAYVEHHYIQLAAFFQAAAKHDDALLLYVN